MNKEDLNSSKVPIIVLDKKLETFRGKVLFPKKLGRANQILARGNASKFFHFLLNRNFSRKGTKTKSF